VLGILFLFNYTNLRRNW